MRGGKGPQVPSADDIIFCAQTLWRRDGCGNNVDEKLREDIACKEVSSTKSNRGSEETAKWKRGAATRPAGLIYLPSVAIHAMFAYDHVAPVTEGLHLTLATDPLLTWVECRNATETPCMSSPETASE